MEWMYEGEVKKPGRPRPEYSNKICKNDEITKTRIKDKQDLAVHQVRHKQVHPYKKNVYNWGKTEHMPRDKNECRRCGYKHMGKTCLAKGRICWNCQKVEHLKKMSWEKRSIYKEATRYAKKSMKATTTIHFLTMQWSKCVLLLYLMIHSGW